MPTRRERPLEEITKLQVEALEDLPQLAFCAHIHIMIRVIRNVFLVVFTCSVEFVVDKLMGRR